MVYHLKPSEISKRTKSRDFFRTRRRRYQYNARLDISKRDSISGVFSYLITRLSRLIIRHPPVSFLSHFTLRYAYFVSRQGALRRERRLDESRQFG